MLGCSMTLRDLHALNPGVPTLEVPCRPSQFPEWVHVWAVQAGTGHIVTDEQPDELVNVTPFAGVFIELRASES